MDRGSPRVIQFDMQTSWRKGRIVFLRSLFVDQERMWSNEQFSVVGFSALSSHLCF